MCCFFFFKQKTAYEMRISDWSSDVCSSDLVAVHVVGVEAVDAHRQGLAAPVDLVQRLDDILARLLLVVGRDRILEVEEHHVGRGVGSLLEEFRVAAWHRQLAAVHERRRRLAEGQDSTEERRGGNEEARRGGARWGTEE